MDARSLVICLSSVTLALSSYIYGWKFFKRGNFLLGMETWIVGISSTNAVIFFATGSAVSWALAHFFDTFSRGFGFPVITIAGLMAVTHGYKPGIRTDVALFVIPTIITLILINFDMFSGFLPYFLLAMWSIFSVYLAYLVVRLLKAGAVVQAMALLLSLILSQAIASIYDFYKIPGEETNVVFNFFTLALLTWAYGVAALYYAYRALERERRVEITANRRVPFTS
ncbi:hypothetical protein EGY19_25430 [Burkholderia multivorans]|uniref:hypothetical protein n=2 Tax=Burkholderia multivorans TaxID=87883 RepID=UPI0007586001|nr:hypothetical protein [Burkholderia multivorans]AYZ00706.1 hypothetical protein EGY19_25430 [Burkholderia multivorans]KVR40700.1 hypothetical protein WK17_21040 [Burkholderia multivorans]KWF66523.1 hypothetical protein WL91_19730 [Burkholderia multivorans]KWF73075.1 hypothetical protein WL92_03405 [Burkholderia multivorans]MBJ9624672.1 hypothetical protein [Burkholderia multivorans]